MKLAHGDVGGDELGDRDQPKRRSLEVEIGERALGVAHLPEQHETADEDQTGKQRVGGVASCLEHVDRLVEPRARGRDIS